MYKRLQQFKEKGEESCFLWGPRQTGKSTLLKKLFPNSPYYDFLLSDEFVRLSSRPTLLREELIASPPKVPVVIDEVQKIPQLLDEIQWLIVNKNIQFILCGSSARKLKRGRGNLLGGRALSYELFPLVYKEINNFDFIRALNHGLIPNHYLSKNSIALCRAYVGDYLKEEIVSEALTRNIPTFARFLEVAAFSNGEMVNYQNIASDTGVSAPTVKEYFQILIDTLIAFVIPVYRKNPKRRVIHAPKFYFFDVGIVNALLKRGKIVPGTEIFGRAFEHFIMQELFAHRHYSGLEYDIAYWRTASGYELDFILGDHEVAVEIKGVQEVKSRHLRGMRAFNEEYKTKHSIIVSLDSKIRKVDNIYIMPWQIFLEKLWDGKLIK